MVAASAYYHLLIIGSALAFLPFFFKKWPIAVLALFIAQPWILNNIYYTLFDLPYVYLTYIILFFAIINANPNNKILNKTIVKCSILFAVYAILNTILTHNSTHSTGILRFLLFSNILPGLLLINYLRSTADFEKLMLYSMRWLIFFNILSVFSILVNLYSGLNLRISNVMNVSIQYSNSALFLVWSFLAIGRKFWTAKRYKKRANISYILSMLLALIVLIASQSRTFMLGSIIVVFAYSIGSIKNTRRLILVFSFISLLLAGLLSTDIGGTFKDSLSQAFVKKIEQSSSEDIDIVSAGRLSLWSISIDNYWDSPVFGVGLGNALQGFLSFSGVTPRAHNMYLQILVELGLVGMVIFSIIIIKTARYLYLMDGKNSPVKTYLISALFLFLFSNFLKADWGISFLLMILIERFYFIEKREKKLKSSKVVYF